jgi:hypothetical protein
MENFATARKHAKGNEDVHKEGYSPHTVSAQKANSYKPPWIRTEEGWGRGNKRTTQAPPLVQSSESLLLCINTKTHKGRGRGTNERGIEIKTQEHELFLQEKKG